MFNDSVVPKVSVIVPVYNAETYLSACVESIRVQDLQDIEIILVDDGSTDRSGAIADHFTTLDSRIRVVHKRNGNPGATRNVALLMAEGEYVAFVDSDDWIEPHLLSTLYKAAVSQELDIVVTGVTVEYTHENRFLFQQMKRQTVCQHPNERLSFFLALKEHNLSNYPVSKLFRTSLIRKHQLLFPEILPFEDLIFNLYAFLHACRVQALPGMPYHYLRRDEPSAASSFSATHLQAIDKKEAAYRQFLTDLGMQSCLMEQFLCKERFIDYCLYTHNLYKPGLFSRTARLHLLQSELWDNASVVESVRMPWLSDQLNTYEKIFRFLFLQTNPFIIDTCYSLLFYMRRKFEPLYRWFRKRALR